MNKKQLWNSILQQAISGKLVPQLDSEPAVEQISSEPDPAEVPFALPEKWRWVQAKYIGSWKSGATPRRDNAEFWENGTVPWLKTGEVSNGLVLATEEFVTEKAVKQTRLRLNPEGSVLIAMYGTGTVGNIGMLGIPCTTNQACCACITDSDVVINWFLFYVLLAFRALLIGKAAGTTNLQNLSKDKIEKIWIPLPPLEEQRRIVAKLDELKPLVDQFGEAYDKLSELEADFPRKLKASILQAAMQGKLVPQLDSEPAVEQIGPALDPDDVPFELPEKWTLVQLSSITTLINGRAYKKAELLEEAPGLTPIIRVGNFFTQSKIYYSDLELAPKHYCNKGDLLFAWSASFGPKIWEGPRSIFHYHIWKIEYNPQYLDCKWLYYWLEERSEALKSSGHGIAMIHITKQEMEKKPIAVPPLEEQRRIVERIEQLFAEVDKMSACKAP